MTKKTDYLLLAIEAMGSESELARKAGYTPSAISKAKRVGHVSVEMAARIEVATQGRIKKFELRPDIFPAPMTLPRRKKAA